MDTNGRVEVSKPWRLLFLLHQTDDRSMTKKVCGTREMGVLLWCTGSQNSRGGPAGVDMVMYLQEHRTVSDEEHVRTENVAAKRVADEANSQTDRGRHRNTETHGSCISLPTAPTENSMTIRTVCDPRNLTDDCKNRKRPRSAPGQKQNRCQEKLRMF